MLQSSLLTGSNHQSWFRVSLLDKYPQPANLSNADIPPGSIRLNLPESQNSVNFQTTDSYQQIYDMEKELTPSSMEMKVERSFEHQMWATRMAKHVMDMNRHVHADTVVGLDAE